MAYPSCSADDPEKVLDTELCNRDLADFTGIYLTEDCGYDNGACCEDKFIELGIAHFHKSKLGDGVCDEYPYNSIECQVRRQLKVVSYHLF